MNKPFLFGWKIKEALTKKKALTKKTRLSSCLNQNKHPINLSPQAY